jgi:hypothetical protein
MLQICRRCYELKDINEFYKYTNGMYKHICKKCENTNFSRYELYTCKICNIVIRKRNQSKHEKSYRHLYCKFWNVNYDSNNLQKQNKRSINH